MTGSLPPYIVVKSFSGVAGVYELSEVKAGVPVYCNPVTTEVNSETYAIKLARQLTAGQEATS